MYDEAKFTGASVNEPCVLKNYFAISTTTCIWTQEIIITPIIDLMLTIYNFNTHMTIDVYDLINQILLTDFLLVN